MASNQRATSWLSAAEPEMKKRMRPPKRSRILVPISLSATEYFSDSSPEGFLPCSRSALTSRPTPLAQVEELRLDATLVGHHHLIRP